jgi:hypothetical protein
MFRVDARGSVGPTGAIADSAKGGNPIAAFSRRSRYLMRRI